MEDHNEWSQLAMYRDVCNTKGPQFLLILSKPGFCRHYLENGQTYTAGRLEWGTHNRVTLGGLGLGLLHFDFPLKAGVEAH